MTKPPFTVLTDSLMHLHAFMFFKDLPDEARRPAAEIERILLRELFDSAPGDMHELDHKQRVFSYLQERAHSDVDEWADRLAQDAERLTQGD